MTTLGAAADQVIIKSGAGFKVPNGAIGSISSTTITSVNYCLGPTKYSNNTYQGWFVFRPAAATAADYIRRVSSMAPATGVVTVDATWADTTLGTEDFYFFPPWMHPQKIIDAANMANEKIYSENTEPLSTKPTGTGISDPGFQNVATSAYSAQDASFAKETAANSMYVMQGFGSGKVTLSADNGYAYQRFDVIPDEPFRLYTASAATAGDTSVVAARDVTGSATIDSVSHAYSTFNWSIIRGNIPAASAVLEARFGGALDTDVIYFGSQCVLFPDRARLFLDTKWDSDFKATSLMSVRLGGSTPTANVFPHASADFIPIPASDYSFSFERGGPNPTAIHWHNDAQRRWYESPVMISGRRPWADFTTALTTASWATDVPGIDKDLWDAYIRAELFSMHDVLRADPENATRLGRANYDLQAVASQFKKTGPARSRSFRPFASAP